MIKFLQSGNRAAKYILAGFLLILAASMVTYLIPGFMSGSDVTDAGVVVSVGGHEIQRADISRMVAQIRAQRSMGPEAIPYITQSVLQRLIQEAEIVYEGERMGLKVSDKELRDDLQNGPYKTYLYPDNKWIGAEGYQRFAQAQNMTVEEFEHQARTQLLAQKLLSVVTANAIVPESDVEQAYKDKNTKVKFQYAVISLDDVQKSIKPTDTELKTYFDLNQARYQNAIPEKRALKYFVINDKDLEAKLTVDPAKVQSYYDSNKEQFRTPERAKVRHILIGTPSPGPDGKVDQKAVDEARAKAEDVLKQVKAGGDFAALANKYSTDPGNDDPAKKTKKGGELGWFQRGQMVAEFEAKAFSQSKGQISDLVQTSFGFHIIQTEDKEEARLKPLTEVKGDIEKLLKDQELKAVLNKTSGDAVDLAQKQGLETAAAKYGDKVLQSNPVARTDSLPVVGAQPRFMDQVFATPDKTTVGIARIPTGTTGYVVFQVTAIEPARKPAFEEIKDRVTKDFKSERGADILRRKTQEMSDRAHAEHDLAKAAKEAGATLKTSDLVGRTQQVPEIGSMNGAASAAFTLKQGEISGPLNFGRSEGVLQIVERQDPSPKDAEYAKQRDQLREQLVQEKQQDAQNMFLNDLGARLEKEGKIKFNKNEIESLLKARS